MRLECARWVCGAVVMAVISPLQIARGQQTPASGAGAATTAAAADDTDRKNEILRSDRWHRAMFEMSEWLNNQHVYTPAEVTRIKADFTARVNGMSAGELQTLLADVEHKLRILDTPEAREVRAWLGSYLAILSDRGREDLLRDIPEFSAMNSARLQDTISRLAQRRDARTRKNTQVQQLRSNAPNPWNQAGVAAQQAAARGRSAPRSAQQSPYRPRSTERPHENTRIGPTRTINVGPYGQFWMTMGF
ncbi:MAG: hypothetical protein AB7O59_15755 [Pirellulales bacterium]